MKKHVITAVKLIVSIGLILFLFIKLGFEDILVQLTSANLYWLMVAILTLTISNILGSFQWFVLMKIKGINVSFWEALSFYYVGLFFNNFLIGYIGGDAIRIYDLSKTSGDSSNAVSTVFFDRFIGFVVLTTLALIAVLIWQNLFQSSTVLLIIIVIFVSWMLSFIFLFNKKLGHRIGNLIRYILPDRINGKIQEIYHNINSYKHEGKKLFGIVLISIVIQSFRVLVHYFAALSIGLEGHLKYFFIFIPIIALLASLPISIGGIGVREGSAVALFSNVSSFSGEMIVVMEFLAYLVGLISALPGGLIFIIRKEKIPIQ